MSTEAVCVLEACARSCNPETWAAFEKCFKPRLVAGVLRALGRGGRRPDSEWVGEMLQEVYCRVLENRRYVLRRFHGDCDRQAHAYLKRVAESVTLDRLRADAAAKRGGSAVAEALDDILNVGVADLGASPEALLLERDAWRAFWRECQRTVSARHRARDLAILQLAVFEGWSSREIAGEVGGRLSVSSIDSIVHRLRRRLAARGIELPERSGPAREVAEGVSRKSGWTG